MESMFRKMSKTHMIIQLCERPRRFGELKAALRISDAGLTKHLDSVRKLGWVKKTKDGSYTLTPAGKRVLPTAQRAASMLREFKRVPTSGDGVSIDYHGLEGSNADTLLRQLSTTLGRFLARQPGHSFSVLINYRPPSDAGAAKTDS